MRRRRLVRIPVRRARIDERDDRPDEHPEHRQEGDNDETSKGMPPRRFDSPSTYTPKANDPVSRPAP